MRRVLAICLLLAMAIGLCACGAPEKKFVGEWVHKDSILGVPTNTTLVFNEDGTGKKTMVLPVEFTYSVEKDKLILTSYPLGVKTTEEYTFSFSHGKLTLTDKDGKAATYEKVTEKE